jgi:arginyl-tRNA synthetase
MELDPLLHLRVQFAFAVHSEIGGPESDDVSLDRARPPPTVGHFEITPPATASGCPVTGMADRKLVARTRPAYMIKNRLTHLLQQSVGALQASGELPSGPVIRPGVERARDAQHGDFASSVALTLAKSAGYPPRQVAERIVRHLPADPLVVRAEVAGPGFINFFLAPDAQYAVVRAIHGEGPEFGRSRIGAGQRVQIEFVSANPTGPLHVGHGRGAVYGSVVASLLQACGFEVHREYYVNDAGRQMDILATSVWLRYLEESGEVLPFPSNGYRGEYIRTIAWELRHAEGDRFRRRASEVLDGLPPDEPDGGDKELYIDAMIERAKDLLGADYRAVFDVGLTSIQQDIHDDLLEFGVSYDEWFSERRLADSGAVGDALGVLRAAGFLYQKDGATWFESTRFGDEKDRVVVRENGQITYFASDIAYHWHKLQRGHDRIINVWGADHHGYVPRVKGAIQALGGDANRLHVLLVQFAVLYRGDEKVQMSTRSGEFITLRQLRSEVGKDAARFFYVMRRSDQHMDFDLKLATSRTNENPVYYVQYAHARICSVFRQLDEKGWARDLQRGMDSLHQLVEPHEAAVIASLSRYPEVIENAAVNHEPHQLVQYLRQLAGNFHTYYNACPFLVDDHELREARLNLVDAVRQVIANGLDLLGVSAPEAM